LSIHMKKAKTRWDETGIKGGKRKTGRATGKDSEWVGWGPKEDTVKKINNIKAVKNRTKIDP